MAIQIQENVLLAPLTTMRVGGSASFFVRVGSTKELSEAILFAREKKIPVFVLGAGSNILFSDNGFSGLVIKIEIKGVIHDDVRITAGAGVQWDDFVDDMVSLNLCGIENLSLIPGTVGGAVVQNIGAYGVEACDAIISVEAFNIETMQIETFLRDECEFGYRESIFKKNKNLIVMSASFSLKEGSTTNINYDDVKKYFENKKITEPTLAEIREAIIVIRTAKMPAPGVGTAGSFFKNPILPMSKYEELKKQFPELKAYPQGDNTIKLSAAWLLDHVGGWRGVRHGDVAVHEKQALILVNYGTASAQEILFFADEMKSDIKNKTDVLLEEEVVIVK